MKVNRSQAVSLVFLVAAIMLVSVQATQARTDGNWPDWRGPTTQGHSDATDLPLTWSEEENVTWRSEIPGRGWSTPIIWAGQIWVTTATEEGRSLIQMFRMVELEHGRALLNIGKTTDDLERALNLMRRISMRISAKNICYGTVCDIKLDNLLAEVCIELKSGHRIVSIITAESVETLGLIVGEGAYAVIKASSVLVSSDIGDLRISAGNQLRGRVVSIRTDAVMGAAGLPGSSHQCRGPDPWEHGRSRL